VSPWAWLGAAGVAEIAWSQSIRPTDGFTRPLPTAICLVLMALAVYPLTRAMQTIPVGTAYVVFTGLGAIGAVVLGILASGDPARPAQLAAIALVVTGVVTLRASGS
jgi:quaternary ammonium compound-resistance protein SugE